MSDPIVVLYVDDEPERGMRAGDCLERENSRLEVVTATSVSDALDQLASEHVECIVSTYRISDQSCIELLQTVRETNPKLPFIVFTDECSEAAVSEAIAAGMTQYLQRGATNQYALLANQIGDIVDRYRAQVELTEQTQVLHTIFENVPIGLYILDTNGEFTRVQGAILEDTGLASGEVIGTSVSELFAEYPHLVDAYERALDGDHATETINIAETVFQLWFQPLRAKDDEITGIVSLWVDITDRRKRERELERRNEQLEKFANVVSHDLRNPLQVAKGHLEHAEQTGDPESFAKTKQAHDRIETIIDDVLTLARHGQTPEETTQVAIGSVAHDALETVDTTEVTLEVIGDRQIDAAPDRLRQLFENLIRNAAEHAGPDVTVTVGPVEQMHTATRAVSEIKNGFYVADDGPGIPEDLQGDVLKSGFSTAPNGTGFGLAIVAQIADVHGWNVTVTESHDGGARFEFIEKDTR